MDPEYKFPLEEKSMQELIEIKNDENPPPLPCSIEDLQIHVQLIADVTTNFDTLLESLRFLSDRVNDDYNNLLQLDAMIPILDLIKTYSTFGDEHLMNPDVVILCLTILNKIISLPIESVNIETLPSIQSSLAFSMNCYAQQTFHEKIISLILDCFLKLIKKPVVDITFFTDEFVLTFLAYLMDPHSPFDPELKISKKSFKICIRMYHKKHKNLEKIFIENNFIPIITENLRLQTPSVLEALDLLGLIGHMNKDIIKELPDDFFLSILPDLFQSSDSKIVHDSIQLCINLADNNKVISEILVNNCLQDLFELSGATFQIKEVGIQLISLLINPVGLYSYSDLYGYSILIENAFLKYGTLDFYTDYLQTQDDAIIKIACESLVELSNRFVNVHKDGVINDNGLTPFQFLLHQSESLYNELEQLNNDENFSHLDEDIHTALELFNTSIEEE